MNYPYMPIGEIDRDKQKKSDIKHVISLLQKYKDDAFVEDAIDALNHLVGE